MMDSLPLPHSEDTEIINRLPSDWQVFFQLLKNPFEAQKLAQVWYNQKFGSKSETVPRWHEVLESLTALEPFITDNGNLDFQLRFTVLPISTQKNFVVFLTSHIDNIPANAVEVFLDKISAVKDEDMWLKFLREHLISKLSLNLKRCGGIPPADSDKRGYGRSKYTFSTEENRNSFQELCRDIRESCSEIQRQHSYKGLQNQGDDEPMEARVTSPVLFDSPSKEDSAADEQLDSQPAFRSPQILATRTQQNTPHVDGPTVKRLKLEASQSFSGSFLGTGADFSFSQISVPLTAEEWELVMRLKDTWKTCSADKPVPEGIRVFLSCTQSQMKEVCEELELDTLGELPMTVCCDHVCSLGDQLSYGNCVEFLKAAILPKVQLVTQTFPQSLCNVLVKLSEQFPRQLIDGVITVCLQDEEAALCQAEMFCGVTKDVFTAASRVYLLQKLLDDSVPVSTGLLLMIQLLIDLKVEMDTTLIQCLLQTLANFSAPFAEDIQFGKLLLAFVTKYGKQIDPSNIDRLKGIVTENRTFLKRAILSAITKLEKAA